MAKPHINAEFQDMLVENDLQVTAVAVLVSVVPMALWLAEYGLTLRSLSQLNNQA